MDRHQSHQNVDFEHLAGLPVFSADHQRVGTVDKVMSANRAKGERYMIVKPGSRTTADGADQLYVPESQIQTVDHDRVILETTKSALPTDRWSSPPGGPRRA